MASTVALRLHDKFGVEDIQLGRQAAFSSLWLVYGGIPDAEEGTRTLIALSRCGLLLSLADGLKRMPQLPSGRACFTQ